MTTPPQPPSQPPGPQPQQPQQPSPPGGFGPPQGEGFGAPQGGYGQSGGGFGQSGGDFGQSAGGFGQPGYPGSAGPGGPGGPGPLGPYGGPPPGPPPNRSNKVVALVVGAVLVVALAVAGTLLFVSGDDGDKGDKAKSEHSEAPADDTEPSKDSEEPTPSPTASETEYELAFPKTLDGGSYKLKDDLSDSVDTGNPGEEAHLGSYADAAGTSRLLYGAASGEDYGNPEMSKNQMMDGMESGSAMDVAVKRRDYTPTGSDDPLTCEVLVKTQQGRKLTIPVCAWSDPGTAAYVAKDSLDTYSVDPKDVDLQKWADRVDGIRDEVRTPAAD
ncbi:hypothetical protein MMF93_19115 [Streptomyces tubbatahanensis]|uniref:Serine/threonine protein kinase n=1 Tax=Streptomyces tubbatahanensis TaxID=2923272 RepID=A0ABY3XUY8_9ACTN|nr:hypothetical protein [Streptomyces tubbatahanensis]UNS98326.1 hypothetical protein MMF93_19115 [Streptomyces tubbatahanensis]